MNILNVTMELKNFGLKEIVYRQLSKKVKQDKYMTLYYEERDKVYSQMNEEQLANAVSSMYRVHMGGEKRLDFANTVKFTEKIQWLKIFDNTEEKRICSDKYVVREYVREKIGDKYLIPLLGVYDSFEQIDFSTLPNAFCLKPNHGAGMNLVVKNKKEMNINPEIFYWWMKRPFWAGTIEPQYKNISRKIIAEEYIEEKNGELYDYKIHCFHGKPTYIQCIGGRDLEKHTGFQRGYDINWNKLDWNIGECYPDFPYEIEKPKCLAEMIEVAKILSANFIYVRVDLYEIGEKVLFGEMTFTPGSGLYQYGDTWTEEYDIKMGNMIFLPK